MLGQRGIQQLQDLCREKMIEIYTVTRGAPLAMKLVIAQARFLDGDLKGAAQCIEDYLDVVDPHDIVLIAHFYHFQGEIADRANCLIHIVLIELI
jgi:hypothetical protein